MSNDFENFKKNLKDNPFFSNINDSIGKIGGLLDNVLKDAGERTIVTKFGDEEFKTSFSMTPDNDVANNFPQTRPKEDDIYWKRHNELVDKILEERTEIFIKVIETAGTTIKGVINPVSISPIDIAKIIESFSKKNS